VAKRSARGTAPVRAPANERYPRVRSTLATRASEDRNRILRRIPAHR
jgi:hypothetical protein